MLARQHQLGWPAQHRSQHSTDDTTNLLPGTKEMVKFLVERRLATRSAAPCVGGSWSLT
jgi:hypothetical protein